MLIGILSGTYSSIFIASPVLTAWKEREPGFVRRRLRIAEVEGHVPAYADDVATETLARDDEAEADTAVEAERAGTGAAAEPEPVSGAVATAELPEEPGNGAGPAGGDEDGAGEPVSSASAERRKRNEERRARRAQRRKHGRKR
jgi:SecD/SecF fusion protein